MCEAVTGGVSDEVRIVQEEHEDPNAISWHIPIQIANSGPITLERSKVGRSCPQMNQTGNILVKRLLKIGGILSLEIDQYKVTVRKGPAFEWKIVNPPTLEALLSAVAKFMKTPKNEIKVAYPDPH